MKKFLKALTAVFAVVILAVTLVGCTANVSGKTYAYSEAVIVLPDDATEDDKKAAEGVKSAVDAFFKNDTLTFNEDGTFKKLSKWTQDGKTVTVTTAGATTATYTVSGKKLETSHEQGGYKFTIVYEQK